MAELGYGYGSEFHLLRMLGRHRNSFDKKILDKLGYQGKRMIGWISNMTQNHLFLIKNILGLSF